MGQHDQRGGWRRRGIAAALVGSGLLAGAVLAGTVTAGAYTSSTAATSSSDSSYSAGPADAASGRGAVDESKSQRPDEHLLTGDTATRVREAALAEYPAATVLRVETDSDGVYEAHLTTADGQRVTVEVGKDFAVTGTESTPHRGGQPQGGDTTQQG